MNPSTFRVFGAACLAAAIAMLVPRSGRAAGVDPDLTRLDRLLSGVAADQRLVVVGDMEILAAPLRAWREALAGRPSPQEAFDGPAPLWTGGKVCYAFSNNVSVVQQQAFQDAAQEWATFAALKFIPRTTEPNYILVAGNPGLGGGQSAVGMVGGPQLLQIGPFAWNRGTLCHEIGHALGLVHEHQRSDRDNYIRVLTQNLQAGTDGNFVRLPNSRNQGDYDFYSVMHYARNAFSIDPALLDTIQPLPAYSQFAAVMGGDNDTVLSERDRAGMAAAYGAGPVISARVTNTLDAGPGSLRAALYFAHDHPGTRVVFDIPGPDPGRSNSVFNILPTDALPTLARATVLDGPSQPSNPNPLGPAIVLNGSRAWTPSIFAHGLRLRGTNCVVRGLVLNGWAGNGVLVTASEAVSNRIEACYLGISADGKTAVTNGLAPIAITAGARGNTVGGDGSAARNVISGSALQGVVISDPGTRENVVAGNLIGLVPQGNAALPNAWSGVAVYGGARWNLIGGTSPGTANVISGNTLQGVTLSDAGTDSNTVAGNYIGSDPDGLLPIPNGWAGVAVFGGARSNVIGGVTSHERNVISGNTLQGVTLSDPGTVGNVVSGNFIGLDVSGSLSVPNGWAGVDLFSGANANRIGPANVISGNLNPGVSVGGVGTDGNAVEGNWIGLDGAGQGAIANGWSGVQIFGGARSNRVGGLGMSLRNVISGNTGQGVVLSGDGTRNNEVLGNFIGLDPAGTRSIPNGWSGVEMYGGASHNLVGGGVGRRNVISGNGNFGVLLSGAGTEENRILGNTLGLDVSGRIPVPNIFAGVELFGGASGNRIGGTGMGEPNLIAANLGGGVLLYDAATGGNPIQGNSVYDNAGSGITLGGGANAGLGAPSLSGATVGASTVVRGSVSGSPSATVAVDFYGNPSAGAAQGRTYLGQRTVVIGGAGSAAFTADLGLATALGTRVTATVTDALGNTSEFSSAVVATGVDHVGDGIPDAWRAAHFGGTGTSTNATSCAACDPDHDGMSNREEFLAGTDPGNAAGVLRIDTLALSEAGATLSFRGSAHVAYRVETRGTLDAGGWGLVADQILGTGGTIELVDPSAVGGGSGYYRVVLP
jgi:hypothetical protein